VINREAQIGRDVTVFHGVTIGQKDKISSYNRETTFPRIEDQVWIGPHAVIIGGVRIGKGSIIGAGTIVTKDIPPHALVVGNPGEVIKVGVPVDVVNPSINGSDQPKN
jgi:serine O-acetyltransferase